MKNDDALQRMKKRYAQLTAQLARIGLILQGTITERTMVRDDPERPGRDKTYGPYYQWTWKQNGKTVTVNLSAPQAKVFQRAIDHYRRLDGLVQEMRQLARAILQQTTRGVTKRKSKK